MPGPSKPSPDPASRDAHLANVLGVVALDVVTAFARAVDSATGLSMVQATALSSLVNSADGGSIDQLRGLVDLSHSAAVRLVDRLVERGLVVRGSTDDARVAAVRLTAAGRSAASAVQAARHAALEDIVATLPETQRQALTRSLDTLAARDVHPAPAGVTHADYLCRLCDAVACGHPAGCPVTEAVRR